MLTALAKLPADRFATAAEFAEALARQDVTRPTVPAAAAGRRSRAGARRGRRPGCSVPAAGAALVLAAAAALWGWLRPAPRRR